MACYNPINLSQSFRMNKNGNYPLVGHNSIHAGKKLVVVPCGRCIGCKMEYSRQWTVRMVYELRYHEESQFITLTYDEDHVPCGEKAYTLVPRDLELFWKRYRKKYGENIRYYACGEYGTKHGRPHYHAIVFGHKFPDQTLVGKRHDYEVYHSDSLDTLWAMGRTEIGTVTEQSIAYVARYTIQKKVGRERKVYEDLGIEPEFTRMSRGSKKLGTKGIGYKFYEEFKGDIFPHDYIVDKNGNKNKPPKYYTNKYALDNPEKYAILIERRKKEAEKRASDNTIHRLKQKEEVKYASIRQLVRNLG